MNTKIFVILVVLGSALGKKDKNEETEVVPECNDYSVPFLRYTEFANVPITVSIAAANSLYYEEETWNVPGTAEIEASWWEALSKEEQKAAASIGCGTECCWDCYQHHYSEYDWSEIEEEPELLEAFAILGWSETSWDGDIAYPESETTDWINLTAPEKYAADVLCYLPETWDGLPLPFSSLIGSDSPSNVPSNMPSDVPSTAPFS